MQELALGSFMSTGAVVDPRFGELHDRAADAFATATIFALRAKKYRSLVRLLTFFGLAIPGAIGAIALAQFESKDFLKQAIYVAAVLGIIQFVISIWAVVANWPESLDYSSSSNAENNRLSDQLKALASTVAKPPSDFDARYQELVTWDQLQNVADNKRDISDGEKVYGHRAALLQFKRKCDVCDEIPLSMKMVWWKRCPRCGGRNKK